MKSDLIPTNNIPTSNTPVTHIKPSTSVIRSCSDSGTSMPSGSLDKWKEGHKKVLMAAAKAGIPHSLIPNEILLLASAD